MKVKLGDVVRISASSEKDVTEECWLLNLDKVEQQTGRVLAYDYVPVNMLKSSIVHFGTDVVLYSKLRPNLNKVVLPHISGYATSEMLPLKPDTEIMTREYLMHYLRSEPFVSWAITKTTGAKMPRLGTKDLLNKEVCIPTLEEQNRITTIMSEIDTIIDLRKQQLVKLDELVKARFVEMFGDCSQFCTLEQCGLTISDGNYSSKYPRKDEFIDSGVPFIRANNIANGTIIDDDIYFISKEKHNELRKGHLKTNDILITTRGNIGQVALVPERHNDSNINAQIVLLRIENDIMDPIFLRELLRSPESQRQISMLQTGTALKQLPVGQIKKMRVITPSIERQKAFSSIAKQSDYSRILAQRSLNALETLKSSLMQQYFG